jgi:hypothetical protein
MSVKALILLSLLALTLNATGMERTLEDVGIVIFSLYNIFLKTFSLTKFS